MSPGLAHLGLLQSSKHTHKSQTHSGLPHCHSRQSLQERQNNSDRMVSSSSNIQSNLQVWHKPMVDMFATKLNHKLPIYVSPVPDANAMNIDALNISWECLDGYAFCPVALIPKVIQKMNTYRCKMIVVAPGWPGMHWFWDLVNLSTKLPLQLPHWPHLLKPTFQSEVPSESHVSESSCLAPRHHSESLESFSEQVADRIKAPQRPSSRRLYESRWSIFELWC